MDGTWQLARFVAGDVKEFVGLRPLGEEEVDAIQRASAVVATMTGHNLIGPLVTSTNRLGAVTDAALERRERAADPEFRAEWSMALDEWLMHLAMFRRRTEREVGGVLGEGARDHALATFQDLYNEHADFRACWEWRNAAQHHVNPLSITRLHSSKLGTAGVLEWSIRPAALTESSFRWPDVAADRLAQGPRVWELVRGAVAACDSALFSILLSNEREIDASADLIFDLCREVLGGIEEKPEGPVSFMAFRADRESDNLGLSVMSLRYDLASHAFLAVDAAREHFGHPRKRTVPTEEGDPPD